MDEGVGDWNACDRTCGKRMFGSRGVFGRTMHGYQLRPHTVGSAASALRRYELRQEDPYAQSHPACLVPYRHWMGSLVVISSTELGRYEVAMRCHFVSSRVDSSDTADSALRINSVPRDGPEQVLRPGEWHRERVGPVGCLRRQLGCDPVNCVVSGWSTYGSCDTSTGLKTRRRGIFQKDKYGGFYSPETTNTEPCETVDCVMNDFVPWSAWTQSPAARQYRVQCACLPCTEGAHASTLVASPRVAPLSTEPTTPPQGTMETFLYTLVTRFWCCQRRRHMRTGSNR
ncbi:hypothetical protein PHYPSEUDO_013156 [Phytophthora pseudosyringae]|uniref:Spondin-like TSP1 domain-containing protein n=1 Tax=Phytophthora pseudosyringae TaxID=221518 RepID=A0A8T1V692_9STRA|nr:hypothetical protein PHYPSEUDO_013156 [Phytophthora pseudosyringae]